MAEPLVPMRPAKDRIATNFGHAAAQYESQAHIQAWAAEHLGQWLSDLSVPEGSVLEIGCGTGLLSRQLIRHFPTRAIQLSDLSPAMLEQCRQQVAGLYPQPSFDCRDGEMPLTEPYALIASSFTIQWFENPGRAIAQWAEVLLPGGYLLLAFPTAESFPEWRAACTRSGIPYSGVPLPDWAGLLKGLGDRLTIVQQQTVEMMQPLTHPLNFFRQLQGIGAHTGCQTLKASQLRHLLQAWYQPTATYSVALATLQRPQ